MADLKYDTEMMRTTAQNFNDIADRMTTLKESLAKQIDDLKSVYWKSDAGSAFQDMYKDGWASNVDKYVAVLNEMASQLQQAASEYDKITDKLKEIEGVSV